MTMQELQTRPKMNAYLLSEDDMEGLAFDTPVPFYDMPVSCGSPLETGNVAPYLMMMPDEVVGVGDVFCTRAIGESMIDLGIMPGDYLFIEKAREYYSHDIVLANIDGERLLKTYYVDENGQQWLVPANKKFSAIKLDGSVPVYFSGKLRSHVRNVPPQSVQSIVESIREAKAKISAASSDSFQLLVTRPECADLVISRLHELMDGKSKPRDVLMPVRAAIEAGAIRRSTWAEFIAEFGSKRVSKGSLYSWTDPMRDCYDGEPQFLSMVEEFRRLTAQ